MMLLICWLDLSSCFCLTEFAGSLCKVNVIATCGASLSSAYVPGLSYTAKRQDESLGLIGPRNVPFMDFTRALNVFERGISLQNEDIVLQTWTLFLSQSAIGWIHFFVQGRHVNVTVDGQPICFGFFRTRLRGSSRVCHLLPR
jgi:hypothetical protein